MYTETIMRNYSLYTRKEIDLDEKIKDNGW